MKKTIDRYWALVGFWEGMPCTIIHGEHIPAFAVWVLIDKVQYKDLKFCNRYARKSRIRPTAFVDKMEQKSAPISLDF